MKDPRSLIKPGNEDSHQIALGAQVAKYVNIYPELKWLFHVPNGGSRNAIEGQKFKAMMVRPGVSDLLLLVPRRGFHGLIIELKHEAQGLTDEAKAKMVSPKQKEFLTFETEQGYCCGVAYGFDEAWGAICWYMDIKMETVE